VLCQLRFSWQRPFFTIDDIVRCFVSLAICDKNAEEAFSTILQQGSNQNRVTTLLLYFLLFSW
jgi:hypothetical protein